MRLMMQTGEAQGISVSGRHRDSGWLPDPISEQAALSHGGRVHVPRQHGAV